jgi:signal peptidase I
MRTPLGRLPPGLRSIADWVLTIAFAVGMVLALKAWVVNPYRIPSSSMEPTLHCARPGFRCEAGTSDRILANRLVYHFRAPKRGDIVVFETPPKAATECGAGGTYVKRLIGLPGETWQERDGWVYIDGRRLAEPYLLPGRRDDETLKPRRIPAGRYFFMGDNRRWSCDSRKWGTVPSADIVGKVLAVYWPLRRLSLRY